MGPCSKLVKAVTLLIPYLIFGQFGYSRVITQQTSHVMSINSTLSNLIPEPLSMSYMMTSSVNQKEIVDVDKNFEKIYQQPERTFQKLQIHSRNKRQVDFNMKYINHQQLESPQLIECNANIWGEELSNNPLMCYQCESYSTDKDPQCDHVIWEFLRPSERYAIRVRCPQNRGHYCVKSVKRKSLTRERKTIRGCHGPGPIQTQVNQKHIPLREGCITYYEGDDLTTTCFCAQDLCNSVTIQSPQTVLVLVVTIISTVLITV